MWTDNEAERLLNIKMKNIKLISRKKMPSDASRPRCSGRVDLEIVFIWTPVKSC